MSLRFKKEHVESIDSTQKELVRRFQKAQLRHGDVLSASLQTDSIGRYERKWVSNAGNLSMSLALNIPPHKVEQVPQLCFVAAVALGDAISALIPELQLQYKWVNDLMVDGKKLGGILCQYYAPFVIIGIGVNVVSHPMLGDYLTTSIAEYGMVETAELQAKFLLRFRVCYNKWLISFKAVRAAWLERGPEVGSNVKVRAGSELLMGQFEGIDASGNMIMLQNGVPQVISYGETV